MKYSIQVFWFWYFRRTCIHNTFLLLEGLSGLFRLVCSSKNISWSEINRHIDGVSRHNKIIFLFNFSLTRPPKKNKQQIESYLHPGKNPVNNNIYLMDDFQPSSLLHLTKLDIRQYRNLFKTYEIGSEETLQICY